MINSIIRFYFLILCSICISFKILNHSKKLYNYTIYNLLLPLFLAPLCAYLNSLASLLTNFIPILSIWVYMGIITSLPKTALLLSILSFCISYCLYALSAFCANIFLFQLYPDPASFPHLLLTIIAIPLQFILANKLFQFKRFKNGMLFISNYSISNIVTIICSTLFLLSTYVKHNLYKSHIRILSFPILIAIFIFLIHWWQAQITKSYKQALINRELESLRMELTEKEKQLAELSARNEELGRLIHKDNKRIPAMEHAVSEFLVMDLTDKEKAVERANTLLIEIQKLSEDRNNAVTEIYARKYKHHNTGINELDTMLNYMEKRAYGEHIKLSIQSAINFHDFVPNNISAEDLSHVLSDLLENAIIASKQITAPTIQLQFYKTEKDFVIEIADNGIPFEVASLVNFGLEQLTTHADTGGSGIGLMDIWKIKEKYGISLHITEYKTDTPYTKKISLIFNKKNRYTISTERKEELLALSKRTDLQVF